MRIIPARAGFTGWSRGAWQRRRDHPRSRGVYRGGSNPFRPGVGSSPLARGLQRVWRGRSRTGRIIPARAGFTPGGTGCAKPRKDHPRSRGVYPSDLQRFLEGPGSSPLARGLLDGVAGDVGRQGIIPARAGFTRGLSASSPARPDHPRSRGVYQMRGLRSPARAGSSPLARGLRHPGQRLLPRGRIIPARAGFTGSWPSRSRRRPDHPRSRGVYANDDLDGEIRMGSSPLARGLPRRPAGPRRAARIIPARAGFTPRGRGSPPAARDHPRSRGVYTDPAQTRDVAWGSSPLARGLRFRSPRRGGATRIIPARAGFTGAVVLGGAVVEDHPRSRGVYSRPAASSQ